MFKKIFTKKDFIKKEIPNGIEICEVQLKSLANKVHNTDVNHEIDPYLEEINTLFENDTKEDLIKKFFSVEFTRFFNYYNKSKDLNVADNGRGDRDGGRDGGKSYGGNATRYFINVGEKDGYDWMKLKDFLKEALDLGRDDVFKVDCKETFSFFNTEKEHQEKVLAFFTDYKENGRFINVEVTEDKGGRGGRSRGGGRRRDGGKGGDRKRRSDGPRGERRSSGGRSDRRSGADSKPRRRSGERSGGERSPSFSGESRPRRSRRRED